jgi:hypothetical protein
MITVSHLQAPLCRLDSLRLQKRLPSLLRLHKAPPGGGPRGSTAALGVPLAPGQALLVGCEVSCQTVLVPRKELGPEMENSELLRNETRAAGYEVWLLEASLKGRCDKRQMDLVPRRENDSDNRKIHLSKREEVTKFLCYLKEAK